MKVVKRGSCSSVRNAQHMKQRVQRSQTTERDTRIDDHSAVLDEPVDHAVTSIAQWCWRPPANRGGNESPRPDGEARPHKQQTTFLQTTVLRVPNTHREPMITKWRNAE